MWPASRAWATSGSTRVVPFALPDGRLNVMVQRIDASHAGVAGPARRPARRRQPLGGLVRRHAPLRHDLVRNGPGAAGAHPRRRHAGGMPSGSRCALDVAAGTALLAAMPPAVAAGAPGRTDRGAAHHGRPPHPAHAGRPRLDRHARRDPFGRTPVRRASCRGRSSPSSGQFEVADDLMEAVAHIAHEFAAMARRADGEPILRARLRLGLPDTGDRRRSVRDVVRRRRPAPTSARDGGDWPLTLEIVDADDRSRWCTADDVALTSPARPCAGARKPGSCRCCKLRLHRVPSTPSPRPCPSWPSGSRERTLTVSGSTKPPPRWRASTRWPPWASSWWRPRSSSVAAPAPAPSPQPKEGDSSGRFGATALVQWQVVVDDTPVSDEVLRRAAEDGANLIEVGGRWVQLDRAEARRALANLNEHRAEHSEMTRAATAGAGRRTRARARGRRPGGRRRRDVHRRGAGHRLGEATCWPACPTTEIHDGVVPEGFTATLRPYQLRGLGWLQFLHGLGLGGCLADDMGLGKTPTTLAHLAGLPGPHLVVCPLSVVRNWESETARFAPFMRVMVHHGTGRAADTAFLQRVAAARPRRHHLPGGGEGPRPAAAGAAGPPWCSTRRRR